MYQNLIKCKISATMAGVMICVQHKTMV